MKTIEPIYNLPGIHRMWEHRWKRYFDRPVPVPIHDLSFRSYTLKVRFGGQVYSWPTVWGIIPNCFT